MSIAVVVCVSLHVTVGVSKTVPLCCCTGRPSANAGSVLSRGRDSFRVLAEMPLVVMLLFQTYKSTVMLLVQELASEMMRALAHHPSKNDAVVHPAKFLEHIGCQVSVYHMSSMAHPHEACHTHEACHAPTKHCHNVVSSALMLVVRVCLSRLLPQSLRCAHHACTWAPGQNADVPDVLPARHQSGRPGLQGHRQ